jgi:integrase
VSPSNRTADRLKALDKALAAGKVTPDQATAERKRLEALGPRWEARWTLPDGKTERTKTFKTKTAAAAYEAEQRGQVTRREHHDPVDLRATLAKVLDFYLAEKMTRDGKPRGSYKNARAHRNNILAVWGDRFTLEALDRDPETHIGRLKRELTRRFPGGHWNNKVTLRAAIAYWTRRKRLRILNPVDAVDWAKPDNTRKQRISFDAHRAIVAAGSRLQPAWLPHFLEMGWETGWRSGEIQDWQAERFDFKVRGEDFPRVKTMIEKQGKAEPVYEVKPISWRAAELVREVLAGRTHGPLWPLKRTMTDRWVRKAFEEAGYGHLRFHDYRRSMKKRMEDSGVSRASGASYTGHSEEMHDEYTIHLLEDHQDVLRKLGSGHGRDMAGARSQK